MEFDGAEALLYVLYAGMVIGICYILSLEIFLPLFRSFRISFIVFMSGVFLFCIYLGGIKGIVLAIASVISIGIFFVVHWGVNKLRNGRYATNSTDQPFEMDQYTRHHGVDSIENGNHP